MLRRLSLRRFSAKTSAADLKDNHISRDSTPPVSDVTVLRAGSFSVEGPSHGNEDRVFCTTDLRFIPNLPPVAFDDRIAFACVFDGHGGEKCSTYLVDNMAQKVASNTRFLSFANAGTVLLDAFKACEDEWNDIAEKDDEFSGSCALACLISKQEIVIAHAGDCRAVARIGKRTIILTNDHRPSDPIEKARILAAGGTIRGGRVQGVLAPSRGFGDLDVKRKAPSPDVIISEPEITTFRMEESIPAKSGSSSHVSYSFVILATDGIWDAMPAERACDVVAKSLAKYDDEEVAARKLCIVASELNSDDCSAVVLVFPMSAPP